MITLILHLDIMKIKHLINLIMDHIFLKSKDSKIIIIRLHLDQVFTIMIEDKKLEKVRVLFIFLGILD